MPGVTRVQCCAIRRSSATTDCNAMVEAAKRSVWRATTNDDAHLQIKHTSQLCSDQVQRSGSDLGTAGMTGQWANKGQQISLSFTDAGPASCCTSRLAGKMRHSSVSLALSAAAASGLISCLAKEPVNWRVYCPGGSEGHLFFLLLSCLLCIALTTTTTSSLTNNYVFENVKGIID